MDEQIPKPRENPVANVWGKIIIEVVAALVVMGFAGMYLNNTLTVDKVDLHLQAIEAARGLYQDNIVLAEYKITQKYNDNDFYRENLAIRFPESERKHVAQIAWALTDLGRALLDMYPASYVYGLPHELSNQTPSFLDASAETRINRQCNTVVREVDAILQSISREPGSVNEPVLNNLHTLRRSILALAFQSYTTSYVKIILLVIELSVLLLAARYLTFNRQLVNSAVPSDYNSDGLFDLVIWTTAVFTSASMLKAGLSALYGLQALLLVSVIYLGISIARLNRRIQGDDSGENSSLKRSVTLLKSFNAGAIVYLLVISVFAAVYFFGGFSTGLTPWTSPRLTISRLNAAAALWASFFLLAGVRAQGRWRREQRWIFFLIGPVLFIISIAYHAILAEPVIQSIPSLADYPLNMLYHLSYLIYKDTFPVYFEIILPRLVVALPMLFLVLQRLNHRRSEREPLRDFLRGQAKTFDLALPFGFSGRILEDGLLLFALEDKQKAQRDVASPRQSPALDGQVISHAGDVSRQLHLLDGDLEPSKRPTQDETDGTATAASVLRQAYYALLGGRPFNVLMAVAMTIISYGIASGWHMEPSILAPLSLSCIFMVAGQFLFNDVMDFEIDRNSKPWRVVASGVLNRRQALRWSLGLTLASLLVSAAVSLPYFALCAAAGAGLILYSLWLKKHWGWIANLVSSLLTCLLCLVGPVVVGQMRGIAAICLAVFFACLAREIAKDVEDLPGDRALRRRSLPMLVGEGRAMMLAFACLVAQVLASYLPITSGFLKLPYGAMVTVANIVALSLVAYAVKHSMHPARSFQMVVKGLMVAYLVAYALPS